MRTWDILVQRSFSDSWWPRLYLSWWQNTNRGLVWTKQFGGFGLRLGKWRRVDFIYQPRRYFELTRYGVRQN